MRFVLDAGRSGPMNTLSIASHTEWTWRSAHQSVGTLPHGFVCQLAQGGEPNRDCTVEPLLTLGYDIAGLRLAGSVSPDSQSLVVNAGHLQLASSPAIVRATVEYSLDDGATWSTATVMPCDSGAFRATFAAIRDAGYVSLRVIADDAAGGRISETITRAYRLAP
jgi:hypothetical protein